jgi:hypothetical protein
MKKTLKKADSELIKRVEQALGDGNVDSKAEVIKELQKRLSEEKPQKIPFFKRMGRTSIIPHVEIDIPMPDYAKVIKTSKEEPS